METFENKLATVLRTHLRGADVDLETLPNGHVCGHVIASGFRGKDYQARRRLIWRTLEEELNPAELQKVSTLLTYTPNEWFSSDDSHPWESERIKRFLQKRTKESGAGEHVQFDQIRSGNCILDSVERRFDEKGRLFIEVTFHDRYKEGLEFRVKFAPDEFLNDGLVRKRLNEAWDPHKEPARTKRNGKRITR